MSYSIVPDCRYPDEYESCECETERFINQRRKAYPITHEVSLWLAFVICKQTNQLEMMDDEAPLTRTSHRGHSSTIAAGNRTFADKVYDGASIQVVLSRSRRFGAEALGPLCLSCGHQRRSSLVRGRSEVEVMA